MVTLDVSVPSPRSLEKAKLFFGEDAVSGHDKDEENYRKDTIQDLVRARSGWLLLFFVGLMLAAVVVEAFEAVLREHVELSYFVPLLIGHGGNTGSQSNATVIRALALGHLRPSDWMMVVWKECAAGTVMGGGLGVVIMAFCYLWSGISTQVGVTVAISLPVVSLWANLLGGVFPLLSSHLGFNPAVTSAPLMTTVVDSTGLILYFGIAKAVMGI
ncbi:hypothetical protein CHLNCDRAFT_135185 [Chlorella variabilis]|uniref:SLC41A/MgtE integral membrane domain-containing protein n=1 Tax=Chlorella variabilis TaxID=554065 RepID=E1ZHP1_CHLVA|nr:hypothetical protein CHLNCDRAFT_135185 [Chlorella variabilis]EFN54495.1 hypothetical protein CHLNCDRAFT_135185 [Chlorella variabilis]|eukprot:XP_005846597.1 hypothetical protein CHLNCDRAFT_135185 [Chlorella variabilis]